MTTYGSVCSGIEAASVAWHSLGWKASWLSEIEPFPSAVLAHHYPEVPNLGDMTLIAAQVKSGKVHAPDVLVGGTPCQAFSVAGLRKGLDDKRGQLTLAYVELANAIDSARLIRGEPPCVVAWENVPGVLSSKDNAFGCFLAELAGEDSELQPSGKKWSNAGCVYGPQRAIAWRVLDAQYFGVAQRRKRVFVIASAISGFDPAAVLFEFDGLRRDIAPSRSQTQDIAGTLEASLGRSRGAGQSTSALVPQAYSPSSFGGYSEGVGSLRASGGDLGGGSEVLVATIPSQDPAYCLQTTCNDYSRADGFNTVVHQELIAFDARQDPISNLHISGALGVSSPQSSAIAYALAGNTIDRQPQNGGNGNGFAEDETMYTLTRTDVHAVCYDTTKITSPNNHANPKLDSPCHTLLAKAHVPTLVQRLYRWVVRRLMPVECERLQGFPDDYTNILFNGKPAKDGPRYKALGNSMAVPCMRWLGVRIDNALRLAWREAV